MRIFPIEWNTAARLAVATRPHPDTAENELASLKDYGYDTLVSLLTDAEALELGLAAEDALAARAGLRFVRLPVPDYGIPDSPSFRVGLFDLHDRLRAGASIAAHCRGGVGRAPLLLASLLVLDGATPEDAWRRLSSARGMTVPDTDEQLRWVHGVQPRFTEPLPPLHGS